MIEAYDNSIIGIIVPQSLAAQRFAGFLRGLKKLEKCLRHKNETSGIAPLSATTYDNSTRKKRLIIALDNSI